jgi:signal transduction histidine kinase
MTVFWLSSSGLSLTLENILNSRPANDKHFIGWLWGPLIERIQAVTTQFLQTKDELNEAQKKAALAGLARQVAHDIRSPLSALSLLTGRMGHVGSKEKSLLDEVVRRIQKISDDLLADSKKQLHQEMTSQELISEINSIVRQKNLRRQSSPLPLITVKSESSDAIVTAERDQLARIVHVN